MGVDILWDFKVPLSLKLEDYEYPPDRQAMNNFRDMDQLQIISQAYIQEFAQPYLNGLYGTGVKISRRQLPELNQLIEQVAAILHIATPQVFIRQDPVLNAYTFGTGEQNILVISHSLYQELNEGELAFILGHEMGHIKSGHILYSNMYHYLLSRQYKMSESLQMAIVEWQGTSEISADRAGLIACQDINIACRALLALSVGSIAIARRINMEEYLGSQLQSLDFSPIAQPAGMGNSHSYIPLRMRQMLDYYYSRSFRHLWSELRNWPDITSGVG